MPREITGSSPIGSLSKTTLFITTQGPLCLSARHCTMHANEAVV